jgi:hypothetical protein
MGCFFLFHLYLAFANKTTNEVIRSRYDTIIFDKGWKRNFLEAFDHNNKELDII